MALVKCGKETDNLLQDKCGRGVNVRDALMYCLWYSWFCEKQDGLGHGGKWADFFAK
jgi:hypothetical protein